MRLVFLGNDPWSVPPLHALAAAPALEVVRVITNPPRPAGRGSRLRRTAVAEAASQLRLPLLETEGVATGEGIRSVTEARAGVLVVVAYGSLLPPAVLAATPGGAVNLHFSLLPRWRGASPVQRALLAGDPVTGVSVMMMDEGLDTGPVLARLETPVGEQEDAGALGARLAALGADLLVASLRDLEAGTAAATPQNEAGATRAPKLTTADRVIDWSEDAGAIARRVRALSPEPGASTTSRETRLKILAAVPADGIEPEAGVPGTLAWSGERGAPLVVTGSGLLRILEVAPAGRRRMAAADWARGARLEPGERLG
jgi:methionyl-tRNA formyltransferase